MRQGRRRSRLAEPVGSLSRVIRRRWEGGRPGTVSWGGHSHRPVPAEPHGPRRCGGPEHSAGLSMYSQEFFARVLRVATLAA